MTIRIAIPTEADMTDTGCIKSQRSHKGMINRPCGICGTGPCREDAAADKQLTRDEISILADELATSSFLADADDPRTITVASFDLDDLEIFVGRAIAKAKGEV